MQLMARIRKPTNLTLDVEVLAQLDAWIEAQPIRAGRSAVIERAIVEFLARQEQPRATKPRSQR
jgi:predicted transcriptional regulator